MFRYLITPKTVIRIAENVIHPTHFHISFVTARECLSSRPGSAETTARAHR